jgi:hypothetical protein
MRDSKGRFLPGPDPDRHLLTLDECRKGFAAMLATPMPSRLRSSLRKKIRQSCTGALRKMDAARDRLRASGFDI